VTHVGLAVELVRLLEAGVLHLQQLVDLLCAQELVLKTT
jgi:hypothetical protein